MSLKTLKAILTAVAVIAVIVVGVFFASRFEKSREKAPDGAGTSTLTTVRPGEEADGEDPLDYSTMPSTVYFNGREYIPRENLSTLLIAGIDDEELTDGTGYRNHGQADFLLLAVFDSEGKTCTLLQIDRNTMMDVPVLDVLGAYVGVTYEQIALAHTYGNGLEESGENTARAVSSLLYGTGIDNYITLTMGAITILNDKVGGITVTIEDDFSGVDDTLVQGETVNLMGEHAFNFVHARYTMEDDANTSRMRRQRTYMTALVDKLKSQTSGDPGFALDLYASIANYMVTDCAIDELSNYVSGLSDYELTEIVTLEGRVGHQEQTDFTEFYPDEAALQQWVVDTFYVPVADGETTLDTIE